MMIWKMWQVEYYETSKGRRPVADFIESLDVKSRAKIARTVDLLEEFGTDLGMPYAKHLSRRPRR
ncbi:MAG: type II toxin-antitoxin system RelE/ParE family toxin [Chloroflexi bacterium]|nr:type II toxin-antitoxin system RelE/ParE family toxin [Chloroflexota bacterium]